MRRIGVVFPVLVLAWSSLAHAQPGAEPPKAAGEKTPASPAGGEEAEVVEEEAVEEVAEEAGEAEIDEGPKPDAKHGVISGKLVDAKSGEEIIDGQCTIVGTKLRGITDADGVFGIKTVPGVYQVRCFFEGYRTARVDNVNVFAGKKVTIKVKLEKDEKQVEEEVVVEVDPDRTTAATQLFLRKNAANVSDAVSAQDIAKTPDRNAADATRRVVGASVVGGRFVFVRGLGDRYTNSLLNGTPLPSPEPDVQAIPLDIFPVAVISDVTILKTFTPDMPADFAGGSVRVHTKSFPSQFFANISVTGGYNTQTTFRDRWTYDGSRTDFLGLDGGSRRIPRLVAGVGKLEGTPQQLEPYGEVFNQSGRAIYRSPTSPSYSISATIGDTKNVFDNPLGYVIALNYSRRWWSRGEKQAAYNYERADDPTSLRPLFDFTGTRDIETVGLGGLATVGYQIGKNTRISTTGLYSGAAEDEVLRFEGFEQDDATIQRVRRSRWVQRQLMFAQVVGEHKLPKLGDALLKWNGFFGQAKRGEPNNTQSVYQLGADGIFGAVNDDGFTHFFSQQKETMRGFGLDYAQPLGSGDGDLVPKIKLGGLVTTKDRGFDARRFRYQRLRTVGLPEFLQTPPEDAITHESVGKFLVVEENTRSTDSYRANSKVYATYLMADLPMGKRLRVIGGERLEVTDFRVVTQDDTQFGRPDITGGFKKLDILPGVNVVYKLVEAMNLRFAFSQTVARPQFREVAPFVYQDFFNGALVYGNTALRRTSITNLDLRWEWFPSADEVLAASVFYKRFRDPIESAAVVATGQFARTFRNAEAATNYGVELEGRKKLSMLPSKLGALTLLGNFTYIHSRVKLAADQADKVTSLERPLQGQSPYVVNLALDWASEKATTKARVTYNVFGRRIDAFGTQGFPDIYEQPRHTVDFSVAHTLHKAMDVKLTAENLLNAEYKLKQGDYTTASYRVGRSYWLTLIYNL